MKKCKTCYLINAKPCYECSACASGDDHYKYWPNTQTNAWAEVIDFMNEEGWKKRLVDGEWKHFCPECKGVKES